MVLFKEPKERMLYHLTTKNNGEKILRGGFNPSNAEEGFSNERCNTHMCFHSRFDSDSEEKINRSYTDKYRNICGYIFIVYLQEGFQSVWINQERRYKLIQSKKLDNVSYRCHGDTRVEYIIPVERCNRWLRDKGFEIKKLDVWGQVVDESINY